jgi:hypothetical protein
MRSVMIAFLAVVGVLCACGPEVEPAASGGCHQVCTSVQPPNREPPHCFEGADGGQICVCQAWETVCD